MLFISNTMATVVNIHTEASVGVKYMIVVVVVVVVNIIHLPSPDFTSNGLSNCSAVVTRQLHYP